MAKPASAGTGKPAVTGKAKALTKVTNPKAVAALSKTKGTKMNNGKKKTV